MTIATALRHSLCTLLIALSGVAWSASPAATEYAFAALGDTPYNTAEEEQFVVMLAELNRAADLSFVVHVGDFKASTTACSDELFLQRYDWFRLSHRPFVYVPGDNEWTDCWRPFAAGRDPLERLAKLREIFHSGDMALGQTPLALTRQGEIAGLPGARYPEHVRWIQHGVLHLTLNLPGADNNRTRMPDETETRMIAVRDWMKAGFQYARERQLPGMVIFIQANPWRRNGLPRLAFAEWLQELAMEAQNYPGNVLLVHGDTHEFNFGPALVDPVTRRPVRNVTRLEVYGSPRVNWVRVTVTVKGGVAYFAAEPGSQFQ